MKNEIMEVQFVLDVLVKRGPITQYQWMPFCPECGVVTVANESSEEPMKCQVRGCAWRTIIPGHLMAAHLRRMNNYQPWKHLSQ